MLCNADDKQKCFRILSSISLFHSLQTLLVPHLRNLENKSGHIQGTKYVMET